MNTRAAGGGASLTAAIARAWANPRGAMARQVREGLSEPRALFHLMLACGLMFVASLPAALRTAGRLEVEDAVSAAVAAHLFGYLALAPFLAYALAAAVHLVARALGGRGGFLAVRSALFWSLLVVAPVALALSAAGSVAAAAGAGAALPLLRLLGYAGLGLWAWVFAASLAEAEGFGATWRVAAGVLLVLGAATLLLAGLGAPA